MGAMTTMRHKTNESKRKSSPGSTCIQQESKNYCSDFFPYLFVFKVVFFKFAYFLSFFLSFFLRLCLFSKLEALWPNLTAFQMKRSRAGEGSTRTKSVLFNKSIHCDQREGPMARLRADTAQGPARQWSPLGSSFVSLQQKTLPAQDWACWGSWVRSRAARVLFGVWLHRLCSRKASCVKDKVVFLLHPWETGLLMDQNVSLSLPLSVSVFLSETLGQSKK